MVGLVFQKLILHNYRALINSVELFKHLPETVVAQLVGTLRSEIFTIGDKVIEAGTRGDSLYFIVSGTLAVYNSTGTEVNVLRAILFVVTLFDKILCISRFVTWRMELTSVR